MGGTGSLEYHATLEFLKRGHDVDALSLPDIQSRYLYYDPTTTCEKLGVSRDDLKESLINKIKRCLE